VETLTLCFGRKQIVQKPAAFCALFFLLSKFKFRLGCARRIFVEARTPLTMLTLILGGARSGKSRLAQRLATPASRVTYVATASAGTDPEMIARIEHHRSHRPSEWRTVEEPLALAEAVENAAPHSDAILIDCLTIWLSNLFWEHRNFPSKIEEIVCVHLRRIAAAAHQLEVLAVSNELGSGTVPEAALTREFRDTQGLLNQWAAELAGEVILTVAGLPLYLKKTN
jgi:adenosylcobinamide kinase/adenosylcobinamide-phosphate guanylyltransferase